MSASWSHNQLLSASFQMGKKNTNVSSFPALLLFLRPDPQRKTQSKHHRVLAEVLRSEYSSGLETGGTKGKKQGKQRGKPGPWRE